MMLLHYSHIDPEILQGIDTRQITDQLMIFHIESNAQRISNQIASIGTILYLKDVWSD